MAKQRTETRMQRFDAYAGWRPIFIERFRTTRSGVKQFRFRLVDDRGWSSFRTWTEAEGARKASERQPDYAWRVAP